MSGFFLGGPLVFWIVILFALAIEVDTFFVECIRSGCSGCPLFTQIFFLQSLTWVDLEHPVSLAGIEWTADSIDSGHQVFLFPDIYASQYD